MSGKSDIYEWERMPWLDETAADKVKEEITKYKITDIQFNKRSFLLKSHDYSLENLYSASCRSCGSGSRGGGRGKYQKGVLSERSRSEDSLEQIKRRLDQGIPSSNEVLFGRNAVKLKRAHMKNLVVLSFGFMLVFSAFFSLRNLQTSLNRQHSLGLFSLACMNATFALGCILANSIIQKVRPKRVMVLMLFGNLLYVASNFYASFFTLVPATLILGFTMANLLVAQSTYLTSIAVSHASASSKPPDHIISVFNGYFLFMMYLAHFVGNLISSVVFYLFPPNQIPYLSSNISLNYTSNTFSNINSYTIVPFAFQNTSSATTASSLMTTATRETCGFRDKSSSFATFHLLQSVDLNIHMHQHVVFILLSIFAVISIQGHLIIAIFLDRLDVIFYKSKLGLKSQVCEIWKLHLEPRMKYMLPLMLYLGFQEAFIYADFTNSYVTCSIGVHMIGFVMMVFSGMDSVASFLCGYLRRYIPQAVMVVFGSLLHFSLLIFIYFWKPSPQREYLVFIVAAGLGVVDGIWQTITNSLCGILFSSKQRVAVFSSLRMYQAIGFTIASVYSHFLYNEAKVLILMAVLVASSLSFAALELHEGRRKKLSGYYSGSGFGGSSSSYKRGGSYSRSSDLFLRDHEASIGSFKYSNSSRS